MIYCKLCKKGFIVSTSQYLMTCKLCQKEFASTRKSRAYCSKECIRLRNAKRSLEYSITHRGEQIRRASEYYYSHIDKARNRKLKEKYGITLEQMNAMVIVQNGACAICLEPFKNTRDTHVDHNHENGQVRQVLCSGCNYGIGHFKEKPINLQRAIEYLQKWNK